MPNHTTNLLTIVGEKHIQGLLRPFLSSENLTKNENGLVMITEDEEELQNSIFLDLNKIVPMPKYILETSKFSDVGFLMTKRTAQERKKIDIKQKKLSDKCKKLYGVTGWYDWSVKYWGTKWNTYETRWGGVDKDDNEQLFFHTAWSPPEPALSKLSVKLKKIVRLTYMDEGYGFFGTYHFYPNGKVDDECYTEHKDVPDELCEELGISTYEEDKRENDEADEDSRMCRENA
jgi:hypothetical protein